MSDLPNLLHSILDVASAAVVAAVETTGVSDFPNFLEGALGGAVLGTLRFLMTSVELFRDAGPGERKFWQFAAAQVFIVAVLAAIGGVVAWVFTGRAGNFLTGFTSLGLLLLIAGLSMDNQRSKKKDEGNGDVL